MHLGKGWVGLLARGSSTRSCLVLISEAGEQSVPSRVKAPRVTSQSSEGGAAACSSPSLPGAEGQSLHFTESLHSENERRRRDPAEERIVSHSVCPSLRRERGFARCLSPPPSFAPQRTRHRRSVKTSLVFTKSSLFCGTCSAHGVKLNIRRLARRETHFAMLM